jgi:hypothetical protein
VSVDGGSKDSNDGDELDSSSGNAVGGKKGTPLKCKGWQGKKQEKRDAERACTKITEDGGDQQGGHQQQGKHNT